MPYVAYHFLMLTFSLIGVSTTIMMVAEALFISLGYGISKGVCYTIVLVPVALFIIGCLLSKDQDLQLNLAKWFSLCFSFLMATVLIGIIMEGVNCPLSPSFLFFMSLVAINVLAAVLHLDIMTLFYGVIYFLFIPSCFIFLQIYSIANLNDVSWGTRQGKKETTADNRTFLQKLFGKTGADESESVSDGTSCSCVLCPTIVKRETEVLLESQQQLTQEIPAVRKPSLVTTSPESNVPTLLVTGTRGSTEVLNRVPGEEIGQIQVLERIYMNDNKHNDKILIECDFGGISIADLRQSHNLEWTKKMTNYTSDEEHLLAKCQREHQQPNDSIEFKKQHLAKREIAVYNDTNIEYMSWALSNKTPFHENCTVHILSNPEYEFWRRMVNPDDGYIGIKTRGKNQDEIKIIEKKVAEELDSFKNEKFMYFLFINALWIIVSSVVLRYTEDLLVIKVPIPDGIANCGVDDDARSLFSSYFNDSEDNFYLLKNSTKPTVSPECPDSNDETSQTVITFQPFSLFFLIFYIVLIVTQFICMIWHR